MRLPPDWRFSSVSGCALMRVLRQLQYCDNRKETGGSSRRANPERCSWGLFLNAETQRGEAATNILGAAISKSPTKTPRAKRHFSRAPLTRRRAIWKSPLRVPSAKSTHPAYIFRVSTAEAQRTQRKKSLRGGLTVWWKIGLRILRVSAPLRFPLHRRPFQLHRSGRGERGVGGGRDGMGSPAAPSTSQYAAAQGVVFLKVELRSSFPDCGVGYDRALSAIRSPKVLWQADFRYPILQTLPV